MTPAARFDAAIAILDRILAGEPAEAALTRWARSSRFAGSGDRAGVRDLVYDSLRRLRSRSALGGGLTGRGVMLGLCREQGLNPAMFFTGERHAASPLSLAEIDVGRTPTEAEALDLPDWLLPCWCESLAADATPIALALRDRAPVWLRVNRARAEPGQVLDMLGSEGIMAAPSPLLPTALRVTDGERRIGTSRAYADGLVELQDLSAQLACEMLPVHGRVLDFCAGGGGKSLALAARGAGPVFAHDIDPARMSDLPVRAARAGAEIGVLSPGMVSGRFDLVIADVPCSGSGTWRRTPDAKWRFNPADLDRLLRTQSGILDQCADLVAPSGHLAFMTCSLLTAENTRQITAFLDRSAAFGLVSHKTFTPLDASDGFFLALLQRR